MGEWLDRAESGGRWTPLHCSRVSLVTACKRRIIRFNSALAMVNVYSIQSELTNVSVQR